LVDQKAPVCALSQSLRPARTAHRNPEPPDNRWPGPLALAVDWLSGLSGEGDIGAVLRRTIEIEQPVGELDVYDNPHGGNKITICSNCDRKSYLITSIEIAVETLFAKGNLSCLQPDCRQL